MLKKLFNNLLKNAKQILFINNVKRELTDSQLKELHQRTLEINTSRAIILSVIFFILQVGFIISDHTDNFYQVDKFAYLNVIAECFGLISSSLICFCLIILTNKENPNKKMIYLFNIFLYIAIGICFSLYCFSDLYRGVFCGTIFFISIIYGLIPFFETIVSLCYFLWFFIVFCVAYTTSLNPKGAGNNIFVTFVVYLASFIISMYLRHNYIRNFADEIKLKKLNEELSTLSKMDFLTNIANRRGLETYIDEHLQKWIEDKKAIGILCLDIDNFKMYNDEFTHPVGDEALKKITQAIKLKALKYNGIASRVGGEEITVLVNNVNNEEELVCICEEIRKDIYELKIKHAQESEIPYVTISLGGSFIHIVSKNELQREIDKTDIELYNAKDSGRNKTSVNGRIYG